MANHVSSTLTLHSGSMEVLKWFHGLCDKVIIPEEERPKDSWEYLKPVYELFDTWDDTEDRDTRGWWVDNIGAKWCHFIDVGDDSMHFESAWGYPDALFLRIHQEACKIDPNVVMTIRYDDEMPNFFGSAVYANGEMYDEEYWDDESYNNLELKFYWDEEEEGAEEPEDFEPTYDRMYEIQDDDISGMLESLAEVREDASDSTD